MARTIGKLRARVRERFQIPGSVKDDYKQSAFCGACAIAQMATQVKSYTPGSCGFDEHQCDMGGCSSITSQSSTIKQTTKQLAGTSVKEQPLNNEARDSNGIRVGAWEDGLCGCFSSLVPNCCMVSCLPCVSLAQIMSRLGMYKFSHAMLGFLLLYPTFFAAAALSMFLLADAVDDAATNTIADPKYDHNADARVANKATAAVAVAQVARVISGTLVLVYLVLVFHLRANIRDRFQLPGNFVLDFITSVWCSCCSIAQIATHVKSYTPGSCAFGPPDTLPAYQ